MRNKYRAKATVVDGIRFDSMAESRRYVDLKLMERAGEIQELDVHPQYPIDINGHRICIVELDFRYYDTKRGGIVVEDVKGVDTVLSKLKRKMVAAQHDVKVEIVKA